VLLIKRLIYRTGCYNECLERLSDDLKPCLEGPIDFGGLPIADRDEYRVGLKLYQRMCLDHGKSCNLCHYIPKAGHTSNERLFVELMAPLMIKNQLPNLPNIAAQPSFGTLYNCFLRQLAQNDFEFTAFFEAHNELAVSETSIDSYVASRFASESTVSLAILDAFSCGLNKWLRVSDHLLRSAMVEGPLTCDSLASCKIAVEMRHSARVEQYEQKKEWLYTRLPKIIEAKRTLLTEYVTQIHSLEVGSKLAYKTLYRMLSYMNLLETLESVNKENLILSNIQRGYETNIWRE